MNDFLILESMPFLSFYEGEDDAAAAAAAAEAKAAADAEAAAAKVTAAAGGTAKTFTQDELNAILAKEKGQWRKQTEEQIKQLETLKKSKSLTDKEKEGLASRIEELSKTLLSKEELARKSETSLKKQHEEEKKKLVEERDDWQGRYTRERIERDIITAAKAADSSDEEQFVDLLSPKARLVQVLDAEGQPTGDWQPQVKFKDVDKDGKNVVLDLSVTDAIKRMKEIARFANLFKSGATGGVGASRTGATARGAGKPVDQMSPAEYRKFRVEQGLAKKRA